MARTSKDAVKSQKRWEEKITRAKQVRKTWKDLFRVQLALDYLDGKQRPPEYNANEWITINNVYSHLKAQLPALYSADPYFYVKLKQSYVPDKQTITQYDQQGKIRSSYLNYLKEELDLKSKARLGIQDAMFSYGILKAEHVSTMVENPDAGASVKGEDGETDLMDDAGAPILEPKYIPVNSRYAIGRVHPDDFVWDEDAGPLACDWNWVAERVRVPYDDLEKNPLFKKSAVRKAKAAISEMDDEDKTREERKKGELKDITGAFFEEKTGKNADIAILWKIWNIKDKTWLVIAEGGEEPLITEEDLPVGIEEHPYSILRFTMRDDSPYPIPPMSQGIDVSKEYNIARSDLLKHRKRFNRKYQVWVGGLVDESELTNLEIGDDGTIIKTNAAGAVVTPIQDAQLDQMRYQEIMALKQDMIEMFGGSFGETRGIADSESATQAGILEKRLDMKEGDSLSMVIDWIRDHAKKLDQLVQAHIEGDEAVRVTGPQGEFWALVKKTDYSEINGEYEYSVNVGATMPRLPQMERSSWISFLQLLANAPELGTSKRLLQKLAEMHHIEDESMLDELQALLKQRAQAMAAGPTGSMPGVPETRPTSSVGGQSGAPMPAMPSPGPGG